VAHKTDRFSANQKLPNISQGNIATCLRCDGIYWLFYYKFTAKSQVNKL